MLELERKKGKPWIKLVKPNKGFGGQGGRAEGLCKKAGVGQETSIRHKASLSIQANRI